MAQTSKRTNADFKTRLSIYNKLTEVTSKVPDTEFIEFNPGWDDENVAKFVADLMNVPVSSNTVAYLRKAEFGNLKPAQPPAPLPADIQQLLLNLTKEVTDLRNDVRVLQANYSRHNSEIQSLRLAASGRFRVS